MELDAAVKIGDWLVLVGLAELDAGLKVAVALGELDAAGVNVGAPFFAAVNTGGGLGREGDELYVTDAIDAPSRRGDAGGAPTRSSSSASSSSTRAIETPGSRGLGGGVAAAH